MPLTELATLSLKQDDASRELFTNTLWPMLPPIAKRFDTIKYVNIGLMLESNNSDVSSEFRPVLGLQWEFLSDFHAFVSSDSFIEFRDLLFPIATGAVTPELYGTEIRPAAVYGCPLTEVFKVVVGDDGQKQELAQHAWDEFVKVLGDVETLSGLSVNLDERKFAGWIGWGSEEERDRVLKNDKAVELRGKLGVSETLLLKMGGL